MGWFIHIDNEKILFPSLQDDGAIRGTNKYLGGIPVKGNEDIVAKIIEISKELGFTSSLLPGGSRYYIEWPEVNTYGDLKATTHDDFLNYIRGLIDEIDMSVSKIDFRDLWEE